MRALITAILIFGGGTLSLVGHGQNPKSAPKAYVGFAGFMVGIFLIVQDEEKRK